MFTENQCHFDRSLVVSELLDPVLSHSRLCLLLYHCVENSEEITNYLKTLPSNGTDVPIHVFLNPHMISSVRHVQLAVVRALQKQRLDQMKSKSIFTEILFSLSSSSNISECLKFFGIQSTSTEILMVAIIPNDPIGWEQLAQLTNVIKGEQMNPLSLLGSSSYLQQDLLAKHLKVSGDELQLPGGLDAAVLARVAIKGV